MTDMRELAARSAEMRKTGQIKVSTNPLQRIRSRHAIGANVSPSLAIKGKCWECMGGSADKWDSDTRANIRDCTAGPDSDVPCPLWEFRPYRGKK